MIERLTAGDWELARRAFAVMATAFTEDGEESAEGGATSPSDPRAAGP